MCAGNTGKEDLLLIVTKYDTQLEWKTSSKREDIEMFKTKEKNTTKNADFFVDFTLYGFKYNETTSKPFALRTPRR